MITRSDRMRPPPAQDHSAFPRPAALGWKLGLAMALAMALTLGSERPAVAICLLLEGLCAALGAMSVTHALLCGERPRPNRYGSWHEAAALGLAALASHLALRALA